MNALELGRLRIGIARLKLRQAEAAREEADTMGALQHRIGLALARELNIDRESPAIDRLVIDMQWSVAWHDQLIAKTDELLEQSEAILAEIEQDQF